MLPEVVLKFVVAEVLSLTSRRMSWTPCGTCLRASGGVMMVFFSKRCVEPQVEGVVCHTVEQDEVAANDS